MVKMGDRQLTTYLLALQLALIILFAIFVRYDTSANAKATVNNRDEDHGGADPNNNVLKQYYPSK